MAKGKKSTYTEAWKTSHDKYLREKTDRISICVPKGKREEYKDYAKLQGKSLTQFMIDCIEDKILDIEFFKDK